MYGMMASKGSINGKVIHKGKGCTSTWELYNTANGKNEFYSRQELYFLIFLTLFWCAWVTDASMQNIYEAHRNFLN